MTTNLEATNVLIIVFALPTCGACHAYIPALLKQVEGFKSFGHPFVVYEPGYLLRPGEIPVMIYDSGSQDATLQALADQYKIEALPTTILITKRGGLIREEGALDEGRIYELLTAAVASNG